MEHIESGIVKLTFRELVTVVMTNPFVSATDEGVR
jgi:hypothetical protein